MAGEKYEAGKHLIVGDYEKAIRAVLEDSNNLHVAALLAIAGELHGIQVGLALRGHGLPQGGSSRFRPRFG